MTLLINKLFLLILIN